MVFFDFDCWMNSEARSAISASGPIWVSVGRSERMRSVGIRERRLNLDTLPLSGVRTDLSSGNCHVMSMFRQSHTLKESLILRLETVALPILRPRIFLDTNICINVANGSIDPDEWRRVQRRIITNYRYCISVITLKELFSKLARGDEVHFDQNKGPLKVLDTPAK